MSSENKTPSRALGLITNQEGWIQHFIDGHKQMPGTPSPDDMRKYPAVFAKMLRDHDDLHVHFYAGHEHEKLGFVSVIVKGRTK